MNNKKMFKNTTMQEVLDKLDLIECFEQQGRPRRVGEVTKAQKGLYIGLGIEPPALI
jgi:hypothetical protein